MIDLVPAVAVGKADGQIVLDVGKLEDNKGQADLPLAYVPRTGEIVLLQMDGEVTVKEWKEMLSKGLETLRQNLTEQGINVNKIVVNTQNSSSEQETNFDEANLFNKETCLGITA